MSYVRMGEDGSDIYVYMTTAGLVCCGGRAMTSTAAMVDHLRGHIADGDCVPPDVIPALEADDEANFPPDVELTEKPQLHVIHIGLEPRYDVRRRDDPEGKHTDCRYFVLDAKHDRHAIAALRAYAASCEQEYPQLAADLRALADPWSVA